MNDEYNLARFVRAQERVYEAALDTLRSGKMCSHALTFIFPSLASQRSAGSIYTLNSLDEARAYLASPLLGGRYRECVSTLQRLYAVNVATAFHRDDVNQIHASLTLFSMAAAEEFILESMFEVWFEGLVDEETMIWIRSMA